MIVIVYPQCHGVGGIARYLDGLLTNLPDDAPGIVVITGRDPHAPPGPALAWRGVEVVELPLPDHRAGLALWSWRAAGVLRRLRREGRAQVVNLHTPPLIPALFMPRSLPLVLTMHSTYVGLSGRYEDNRHFPNTWGPLEVALKMRLERWLAARARTVITLTEQGRRELACYGRHDRVAIVPNGVDTRTFSPGGDAPRDIDVVFSGRIEVLKGSQALVQVCRQLVRLRPGIRLAIVGYGGQEPRVRQALAPLSGNVVFAGRTPFSEMAAWYRRSRVYASTSFHEGLPSTCLEAMACGLPAVVWDRLFYRGLVDDGVTGCLVETGHTEAMARRLIALLDDPAQISAMGLAARGAVQAGHDWRQLSRRVLEACVQPPPPPSRAPQLPGAIAGALDGVAGRALP